MRYIIGFLVTLGLLILVLILILSGGGKSKKVTQRNLEDYANTDTQVSLTIDGPINAASLHQQVNITVDNTNVTYQHIVGYDGNVVDTQIFANTENSYDVFLHALRHAGFTKGNSLPGLRDEKGYCPLGSRYIFELTQDNNTLQRTWATSCGTPKTFLGATNLTLTLFQNQVPGYSQLVGNIQL